jgi:hypothetical protein
MFALGFIAYLMIHFLLYKPVFMHVMAHEITHALWALPFGGRTKKLEVSKEGGRVLISKSNFLISLAPYFFPLYALFFTLIFFIADQKYRAVVAFFVGASLSFHIALTLFSLRSNQSDFHADSNIIFSLTFIYFMNILVIAGILAILSPKVRYVPFLINTFKGSYGVIVAAARKINEMMK